MAYLSTKVKLCKDRIGKGWLRGDNSTLLKQGKCEVRKRYDDKLSFKIEWENDKPKGQTNKDPKITIYWYIEHHVWNEIVSTHYSDFWLTKNDRVKGNRDPITAVKLCDGSGCQVQFLDDGSEKDTC